MDLLSINYANWVKLCWTRTSSSAIAVNELEQILFIVNMVKWAPRPHGLKPPFILPTVFIKKKKKNYFNMCIQILPNVLYWWQLIALIIRKNAYQSWDGNHELFFFFFYSIHNKIDICTTLLWCELGTFLCMKFTWIE